MAARLNRTRDLPNVGGPLFWRGEEMKNSAVMPHVIGRRVQLDPSDICSHPVNSTCDLLQPLLGGVDRYLRNIQDRDVLKSSREQVIYKCGFTSAYIDDRRGAITDGSFD